MLVLYYAWLQICIADLLQWWVRYDAWFSEPVGEMDPLAEGWTVFICFMKQSCVKVNVFAGVSVLHFCGVQGLWCLTSLRNGIGGCFTNLGRRLLMLRQSNCWTFASSARQHLTALWLNYAFLHSNVYFPIAFKACDVAWLNCVWINYFTSDLTFVFSVWRTYTVCVLGFVCVFRRWYISRTIMIIWYIFIFVNCNMVYFTET